MKTISELNKQIMERVAVVRTLEELCRETGNPAGAGTVDVIVFSFVADISGTAAMFCVPVAERGLFTRASEITLNGVRGHPGPAPNERLGVVDALVFADERQEDSHSTHQYDGAALFLDLLGGDAVEVECLSVEETRFSNRTGLESMEFARLYVNNASFPLGGEVPRGVVDSLQAGTSVVLNGSPGIVVGLGTRHRHDAPTLSLAADLWEMDRTLMTVPHSSRPCHTVALAIQLRDAAMASEFVAWAKSNASSSLLAPSAKEAANRLQSWIQEGRFLLTETGVPDSSV